MNLSALKDGFLNRNIDLESIIPWIAVFGSAVGIIIILFIISAIKAKKNRRLIPGSIGDPETIRMFIRQGFEQRRPFDIQVIDSKNHKRPILRTSPELIGSNFIVLEANGVEHLSRRWEGKEVDVYFRVNIDGDFLYYTFSTKISSFKFPMKGLCHLTVDMPKILENRQKRSFLRIKPPEEYFRGAALWYGFSLPDDSMRCDISTWPTPDLFLLPGRVNQFNILNLSAGGMRIRIPSLVVKENTVHINSVERLILLMDLIEPEQNKLFRIWLHCRVQSVWSEYPSKDLYMGVQFLSWGRTREIAEHSSHTEIEWLRLPSSSEVEPLGNWIMRRHLEMFREMPHDRH